jgi:DNA-binding CsgD family transcriptional regulator
MNVCVERDLARAGRPIVEHLAADVRDAGIGVALSDARVRIVVCHAAHERQRREFDEIALVPGAVWSFDMIGTTALGLASSRCIVTRVDGCEHTRRALQGLTTVAAPIADPQDGSCSGAVLLVCATENAEALMVPVARRAARDIEQRLLDECSAGERLLELRLLRARRRDRATHSRRLGWSSLTETERQVAALVTDGMTNKEVSALLFMSRHTVDAHLRHIYCKLDVGSRVELTRLVATRRDSDEVA